MGLLVSAAAAAQPLTVTSGDLTCQVAETDRPPTRVTVDDLLCIPQEENQVVTARLEAAAGGDTIRVYFRRLHHVVEDFYHLAMRPSGDGRYWAVLPKPQDRKLQLEELDERRREGDRQNLWAAWWRAKEASDHRDPNDDLDSDRIEEQASLGKLETRSWMAPMAEDELQGWLEGLENEPAEYFAAVFDSDGRCVAKSEMKVTLVTADCPLRLDECENKATAELSPEQQARQRHACAAESLTVGETAAWQIGERVFHWKCPGIESRISAADILRADEVCRACVLIIPAWTAGLAAAAPATVTIIDEEPEPASPEQP